MKRFPKLWLALLIAALLIQPAHAASSVNWQLHEQPVSQNYLHLRYGNDRFVATALTQGHRTGSTSVSADGETWRHSPLPEGWRPISLLFAQERFILAATDGLEFASFTSPDGETWVDPQPLPRETEWLAFGGERYFAGGGGKLYTAPDRSQWAEAQGDLPAVARSAAYGYGTYVVSGWDWEPDYMGRNKQVPVLSVSTDGATWSKLKPGGFEVVYCNGRFVTDLGLVSPNGLNWTEGGILEKLYGLTCSGDRLFAMRESYRQLLTSADGEDWVAIEPQDGWQATGIAFGGDRLVMAGPAGSLRSTALLCAGFFDVEAGDPGCQAIAQLTASKVVSGFPGGLFRPDGAVSRGEMAKMLVLALGQTPRPEVAPAFHDVGSHWAANQGYIQAATALGALNGFGDGSFRPQGGITRSQAIKIVTAASGLTPAGASPYSDAPPDAWFAGWTAVAMEAGLIGPGAATPLWTGPNLEPDRTVTRAEAAILLANLKR